MAQRVYTTPVQLALFESLKLHAGPWNKDWQSGHPKDMSVKDWDSICALVHRDLVKKFKGAAPKTARSVSLAVWFTLELAGAKPQQPQFRLSAYAGGFLLLSDILTLETRRLEGQIEKPPADLISED